MTKNETQPSRIDSDIYQATQMAKVVMGNTSVKKLIEGQLLKHPVIREQHKLILDRKKVYDSNSTSITEDGSQSL